MKGKFTDIFQRHKQSQGKFTRSKNYRKEYLKKHKGFFGIYTCAYCGKLISKSNMEVDHIYPVNGVSGGMLSNTGGKMFITVVSALHGSNALKDGVNADWNKTSACHFCNNKKTDSKGAWVVRGYFGKILFPIMNAVLVSGLLYSAVQCLALGTISTLYKYALVLLLVKGGLFYLTRFVIKK